MKTSARNQLSAKITEVKIVVETSTICAIVINESIDDLAIAKGDEINAIFKASSVILVG